MKLLKRIQMTIFFCHFKPLDGLLIILFDPNRLQHNNIEILEEGTPMTLTNLTTHVLANGDRFNIDKRLVKVLPMEAESVKHVLYK